MIAAAAGTLIAGSACAGVNRAMNGDAMLGISQKDASLVAYSSTDQTHQAIGTVRDHSGAAITGIQAAGYFPGFQNIFALWTNPADHKNKLLYIDAATAKAAVIASDVEGGRFTGAVTMATASSPWTFFAIQQAKVKPPSTISGVININPNNSGANEFSLTTGSGAVITRDTLADAANLAGDGTLYQGAASALHVKPKGNGNQNSITLDGKPYALRNSNTYDFDGDMQVRLYNDKAKGGKAMGHWYIQVVSGTITLNHDVQVLTPNRLTIVDQKTGTVTEVMRLGRPYVGLASQDGKTFYTSDGSSLVKIDTASETETVVGTLPFSAASAMIFEHGTLLVYDLAHTSVAPVDPATAARLDTSLDVGLMDTGSLLASPPDKLPVAALGKSYD